MKERKRNKPIDTLTREELIEMLNFACQNNPYVNKGIIGEKVIYSDRGLKLKKEYINRFPEVPECGYFTITGVELCDHHGALIYLDVSNFKFPCGHGIHIDYFKSYKA